MIQLHCPACRSIDWFHDGFSIAEDLLTGQVERRRVQPRSMATLPTTVWSCAQCGHELDGASQDARYLHALSLAQAPTRQRGMAAMIAAALRS
jgi:hypothetical protein